MELLTVREVAQELRVSPMTVRRYIASGKLPAVRVGRGIRVERAAIVQFVEPVNPAAPGDSTEAGVLTFDDPLLKHVGIINDDGPTDLSVNHDTYLAEAYGDLHGGDSDLVGYRSEVKAQAELHRLVDRLGDGDLDEALTFLRAFVRSSTPSADDVDDEGSWNEHEGSDVSGAAQSGRPTTEDDPLWNIIGLGASEEPSDVRRLKDEYLAEAYLPKKSNS